MEIQMIAKKIKEQGGRVYLVGGAIRDAWLGKKIYDEDYCVVGITKVVFLQLFPQAKILGKSFPVFEIDHVQFALARKEIKIGMGHKKFEIIEGQNISIEEDLARRDITINAIAKDVLTGEIIDPFEGRKDLKNKIIRAVSESFCEDPLRVYRVSRIAAQTGFTVEENTLKQMGMLKEELLTLPKERIFAEFKKALEAKYPSYFFETLRKANVLSSHFQEIFNLIGALQPEEYHPEGDSYQHTLAVLDQSAVFTKQPQIRFASLVHDLGKGVTKKEYYPHHYGHEEAGVELVETLANTIGLPKRWRECGKVAAKEHMKGGMFHQMSEAKKVQFIERIEKTVLGLEGLQIVVMADHFGRKDNNKQEVDFITIAKTCLQQVNGKTVCFPAQMTKGKKRGEYLHQKRVEWMKKNHPKALE